jgi:hypothetical protein
VVVVGSDNRDHARDDQQAQQNAERADAGEIVGLRGRRSITRRNRRGGGSRRT